MSVLLALGSGPWARLYARMLSHRGVSAECVEGFEEARRLLSGRSFRAAVIDLRGSEEAWSLLQEAAGANPPVRVIALASSPAAQTLRRRAYGSGAWELIEVPTGPAGRFFPSVGAAVLRALDGGVPPAVLFVDDAAAVVSGLGALLALEGFQVEAASTAAEARRLLECRPYALVIVEPRRPGPDGFLVLRDVSRLQPGLPAIVLSAARDDRTFLKAVEMGARACLWKLSEPEEILRQVREAAGAAAGHPERA